MQKIGLELVFLLDRSASMIGLEKATVEHFNALIEKQKQLPGECIVSTVLFDTSHQTIHDRIRLKEMQPMQLRQYETQGHTALYDAIGMTVDRIKAIQQKTPELPEQTMFVIITDGMENASKQYDGERVKNTVAEQKRTRNWKFLFLGANVDAVSMAREIGIDADQTVTYVNDDRGIKLNYEAVGIAIEQYRRCRRVLPSWSDTICRYCEYK